MSKLLKQVVKMDPKVLQSKFRGCLLGGLAGDCLGAPYEGDYVTSGDKIIIQRYFDQLESPAQKGLVRSYTDDTAMMKSIAQSLIDTPEIDYKHMATLFVKEYFTAPHRGYGAHVVDVFQRLRKTRCADAFAPAGAQFGGAGSFGNGGAMRVAPVALYFARGGARLAEAARQSARITHTHALGVGGAVLQALAVRAALRLPAGGAVDAARFCDRLAAEMRPVEAEDDDGLGLGDGPAVGPYEAKLGRVKALLEVGYYEGMDEEVIRELGNSIGALESVPTAIYCFLRATKNDIGAIKSDNLYRRTIQGAVNLGGDTDTIACMAGSIAGAFVGQEGLNETLISQCEFHKEVVKLADDLFDASYN